MNPFNRKMSKKITRIYTYICMVMVVLVALSPSHTAEAATEVFAVSGTHSYVVPAGVTSITVKTWGAGGGGGSDGATTAGGVGGGGGYAVATMTVTPGETLTVYVGAGGVAGSDGGTTDGGGGGGGLTKVMRSSANLIIAAGGGGGGGGDNAATSNGGAGGAGGGTNGSAGVDASSGASESNGATNSAGGGAGAGTYNSGAAGASATGGAGADGNNTSDGSGATGGTPSGGNGGQGGTGVNPGGGGGGAGYYGGGGGGSDTSGGGDGGGGGSSYATTTATSITLTSGSGQTAGNAADANYAADAGKGGAGDDDGNDGRVVISYATVTLSEIYADSGADTFVVPTGVTSITVKMWGAGGAGGNDGLLSVGGAGGGAGYTQAVLAVTPGETLNLHVGSGGVTGVTGAGVSGDGGGGGGFSEVARSATPLMIAAGGGGGGGGDNSSATVGGAGGAGGGTSGVAGSASGSAGGGGAASSGSGGSAGSGGGNSGTAGASEAGGLGGDGDLSGDGQGGVAGTLGAGAGGNGTSGGYGGGGGGGGGYYGGGGGSASANANAGGGGGGGGSSYIVTTAGGRVLTAGSGTTTANTADSAYAGTAGKGGVANSSGSDGRIVISYEVPVGSVLLSGTLYQSDGVTEITSAETITMGLLSGTTTLRQSVTSASGDYGFTFSTTTPGYAWSDISVSGDNDIWYDVAYGNGVFVAVGSCDGVTYTNCVMRSTDGVNWSTVSAVGDNDIWSSVAYGNGRFVAVGLSGDRTMYSTDDGLTWTAVTAAGDDDSWLEVAYGNGRFVAVACGAGTNTCNTTSGDRVMHSTDGTSWTAVASGSAGGNNDSWRGLTYGDGTFVAVGSAGSRVMYSTDTGSTWTVVASGNAADDNDSWNAVTYGDGKFVAVGFDNTDRVMTSTDGTSWIAEGSASSYAWRDVVYLGDRFLAVACGNTNTCSTTGSNDRLMSSPDGYLWSTVAVSGNNDVWYGMATSSEGLVVVGDASGTGAPILYSDTIDAGNTATLFVEGDTAILGATMTYINSSSSIPNMHIWDDTVRLQHATTGGTINLSSATFYDYDHDPEVPFDMESGSTTIGTVAATTNYGDAQRTAFNVAAGTNLVAPTNLHLYGNFTQNGTFDDNNGTIQMMKNNTTVSGNFVDTNALNDVIVNPMLSFEIISSAGSGYSYYDITYGNGLFVAVGQTTAGVMTSPDGITWTRYSVLGNNDIWYDVTYGNGLFVAVGYCDGSTYTQCVMTSTDGSNWTVRSAAGNNVVWTSVTYGNGLFVAVGDSSAGNGGNRVMTSSDGVTWTTRSAAGNNDYWKSVIYANSIYLAVGNCGNGAYDCIMYSSDGTTWTVQAPLSTTDYWYDVTYGNGLFVAVGSGSTNGIMTSSNGSAWNSRTNPQVSTWDSVAYGDGLYIAVCALCSDEMMSSSDAITWTTGSAAGSNDYWRGIIYANDRFVAVSNFGDSVMATRERVNFSTASTSDITINSKKELVTTSDFTATGVIANAGTYTNSGTAVVTSNISGVGTLDNSGTLSIGGAYTNSSALLNSGSLTTIGTLTLSGTTTNLADIYAGGNVTNTGVLDNDGTFHLTGSSKTFSTNATTTNLGNIRVTGDVDLSSDITVTNLSVASGGTLGSTNDIVLTGELRQEGSFDHTGVVYIVDASATLTGDFTENNGNGLGALVVDPTSDLIEGWSASDEAYVSGSTSWLDDLLYVNGNYVGLDTTNDRLVTSSDGEEFDVQTVSATGLGIAWAYGNGTYVALQNCDLWSVYNCLYSSTDGVSWTARSAPGYNTDVSYLNGLFVLTSACIDATSTVCIRTSTDGVTWNNRLTAGTQYNPLGTAYGNGTYVAVGQCVPYTRCVFTSPDGTTWTARSVLGNNDYWQDVTFGNGKFVAFGNNGAVNTLMYSTDGISWTEIIPDSGAATINGWGNTISYSNGLFAVPVYIAGVYGAYVSSDGITWSFHWNPYLSQTSDFADGAPDLVALGDPNDTTFEGAFVKYGTYDVNLSATETSFAIPAVNGGSGSTFNAVAYGNGQFIGVASSYVARSYDGEVWKYGTNPTSYVNQPTDVIYAEDRFVMVGDCPSGGNVTCVGYSYIGGVWATTSASSNNDSWEGLAHGEGMFVAVGDSSTRAMYSSDAISWTEVTSVAGNNDAWRDVTYGNGKFVAVACGNSTTCNTTVSDRVMYSTNGGVSWTAVTGVLGDNDEWQGIAYGNNTFVAVSQNGNYVMTSPDGITWTNRTGISEAIYGVEFLNGEFVAMGVGKVWTSADGITWSTNTVTGTTWIGAAYGEGRLVVVGVDSSNPYYPVAYARTGAAPEIFVDSAGAGTGDFTSSADARVLNAATLNVKGNFDSNGYFANTGLLELSGSSNTMDATHPDIGAVTIPAGGSITFTSNATTSDLTIEPFASLNPHTALTVTGDFTNNNDGGLSFSNNTLYLTGPGTMSGYFTGTNALDTVIVEGRDTTPWTYRSAAGNNDFWKDVAYGNGVFVAVSDSSERIMRSTDMGVTWSAVSSGNALANDDTWTNITYGNGTFVAVSNGGDRVAYSTDDGATWTAATAAGGDDSWQSVMYANGKYVAVGSSGDRVITSSDAISWAVQTPANTYAWQTIAYGAGTYVAVACGTGTSCNTTTGNRVMTSVNATAWTARSAATNNDQWYGLAYGNGTFVAVGNCITTTSDCVMYSTNKGVTWATSTSAEAIGDGNFWSDITFANGLFVAVGCGPVACNTTTGGTRAMYSVDGITWTAETALGDNDQWRGVEYGNGTIVAVGRATDRVMTKTLGEVSVTSNIEVDDLTLRPYGNFAPDTNVTVRGNYANSGGTLMASTSNFIFAGSAQQTLSGHLNEGNSFNDLTLTNTSQSGSSTQSVIFSSALGVTDTYTMLPGTSARFLAGATSTLQNIDLQGNNSSRVYLRSSSLGSYWGIDVPGNQVNVDYVNVRDSYASTTIVSSEGTNVAHNVNWSFFGGSTTIAVHSAGPASNAFIGLGKSNKELFAFRLTPITGSATVNEIVFTLADNKKLTQGSLTNVRLLQDNDNDGAYDAGDTVLSTGTVLLGTATGTITFPDDFALSSATNYIVVANWATLQKNSFINMSLPTSGVTITGSIGTQYIYGSIPTLTHYRSTSGGGGGGSDDIGGPPPEGDGDVGGGGQGGSNGGGLTDSGQTIDNDPSFRRPSAHSGAWSNGANAYNGIDGSYAQDSSGTAHNYTNHGFVVPGGNSIVGVEVKMELRRFSVAGGTMGVQLSWNNGANWTTLKSTDSLSTTDTVLSVGGPVDTWGRSWSVDEFSNANFIVRMTGAGGPYPIQIDEIQVRVYYQTSGGGGGGGADI